MRSLTGGFSAFLGMGLLVATAGIMTAQQPSSTTSTQMGKAESTTATRVIDTTIVSVDGNKVVGRDASGKTTEYNPPEGFKLEHEGKQIGVADLKPGMHVKATITTTTTTTPVTVTDIRKGKVLQVSGDQVIVRGPNGVRRFSNADAGKHKAKIMRDGKEIALSDLRAGDNFTAVIITDQPPTVVSEREAKAYASNAPAPAPAAAASAPSPAPAPAAAPAAAPAPAPAPAKHLPKTATQLPLVAVMGALLLAAGFGLSRARRFGSR
jgi:hypothetical protein